MDFTIRFNLLYLQTRDWAIIGSSIIYFIKISLFKIYVSLLRLLWAIMCAIKKMSHNTYFHITKIR